MQKLPIGIQDFKKLRKENHLYVDKTQAIYPLAIQAGYYFLSRPRRFGKSLLLSTLKELFSGSKELFEGLWIEKEWDWGKKYPIVHIPFSSLGYKSLGLEKALQEFLDELIEESQLLVNETALEKKFKAVLEKLSEKGPVVLLVDEYDKPIIDYLGKEREQAVENQQVLKKFYSIIKDADPWLHLVFITGVSRFSRVSIFSDLNNLNDITLTPRHSTLLGYTEEELVHHFKDYFPFLAKESGVAEEEILPSIRKWYDGYSWDGKKFVYNPFSILLLCYNGTFSNFWFKTATPTFLIDLLRKEKYYDFDGIEVGETAFDAFDIEHLNIEALLFQTGYLSIKKYDSQTRLYTLAYPNQEVRSSMLEYLMEALSPPKNERLMK